MIIFHEGMPRAGKSLASVKDYIVPGLKKGRKIYARLDGINWEKLAALAEITEERCRELLIQITEEEVHQIWKLNIEQDALVIIDELQNYWPQGRAALPAELVKFIAEHGHHGLDILNMGQLLKDCHKTWVNRTNRKTQFIKKDMLGKPNEYKWIMYTGRPDKNGVVKFEEVGQGDGEYEEKYFGCYKSHSEGTENKETFEDSRVNIFKTKMFRVWIPLAGVAALFALGYLVYLFNGGLAPKPVKVVQTTTVTGPEMPVVSPVSVKVDPAKVAKSEPAPKDYKDKTGDFDIPDLIATLSKENRIRVAFYSRSAQQTRIVIEWRDSAQKVVDSLETSDLELLGWHVMADNGGRVVMLARPGQRLIATAWPLDVPEGKVTNQENDNIRAHGGADTERKLSRLAQTD